MIKLDIDNENNLDIPDAALMQNWAAAVLDFADIKDAIISIKIATVEEIQSLNHQYRHKDQPTNVLSFPFELPAGIPEADQLKNFIGDIIICPYVLAQEAKEQKKTTEAHWCHIFIHGILHLIGYDHIIEDEAIEMEHIEITLLKQFHIDNPYIEKE
ncbi:MAG: rRNA maturation RNase YbeY [Francisellaceae bacterium]